MPMLDKINEYLGRLIFYKKLQRVVLILGTGFIACSLVLSTYKYAKYIQLKNNLENLSFLCKSTIRKRAMKKEFLEKQRNFDPYFIANNLESIQLCEDEKLNIKKALTTPGFIKNKDLLKRLKFLESSKNKISFIEDNIIKTSLIKESYQNLLDPVEIEEKDLIKLLSIFDDRVIDQNNPITNQPQLIIKNFRLTKKVTPLNNQIFLLNINLIKREFLPQKKS